MVQKCSSGKVECWNHSALEISKRYLAFGIGKDDNGSGCKGKKERFLVKQKDGR